MVTKNNKKTAVIRLDDENYEYIVRSGKANNRKIGGQTNWICRAMKRLQEYHKGTYSKIVEELESMDFE